MRANGACVQPSGLEQAEQLPFLMLLLEQVLPDAQYLMIFRCPWPALGAYLGPPPTLADPFSIHAVLAKLLRKRLST